MKRIFFTVLFLLSTPAFATDIPMEVAVLRGLDKVTGRTSTFSVPVGEVLQFGRTYVVPESCFTRPPEESPENAAYLYVYEKSARGENIELFKGWMFSSNPALSSMEHPVYDIWVIGCVKAEEPPTPTAEAMPTVPDEPLTEDQINAIADEETQADETPVMPSLTTTPQPVEPAPSVLTEAP